jgi:hypothetical protein
MADMKKLLEAMYKFAGGPDQKIGRAGQVKGTQKPNMRKARKDGHPFYHDLVGNESQENSGSILKELSRPSTEREKTLVLKQTLESRWEQFKREAVNEYGGTGAIGAEPQSPQGSTQLTPQQQLAQNTTKQINRSVTQLKPTISSTGPAQQPNQPQLVQTLAKTSQTPNTQLNMTDKNQLGTLAPAVSDVMSDPQTANQFKQLVTKSQQTMQAQKQQAQRAQQQPGTNNTTQQQQQNQQQNTSAQTGQQPQQQNQNKSAGSTQ